MSGFATSYDGRIFVVLVQDDQQPTLYWPALWNRQRTEVWRGPAAIPLYLAVAEAETEQARRRS